MGMTIDRWDIDGKEAEALIIKNYLQIRNRGTIHNIELSTIGAIPKDQYENRLKADMVAMLTELQLEIEEMDSEQGNCDYATSRCIDREKVNDLIQEKINSLKEQNT